MTYSQPLHWPGPGMFQTVAVGTSHCRESIASVAQNSPGHAAFVLLTLRLVGEPSNRFDPNAVSVRFDGLHVGYLSRADAERYQMTLAAAAQPFDDCTVDAVITGGLITGNRSYEYSIELDAALDTAPNHSAPEFPEPLRINDYLPLRPQADGAVLTQAWLPFRSHEEISSDRAAHAYHGKDRDTVAIYMDGRQRIGYGEKIYELPLARCLELFGTDSPDVTVTELRGRLATLRIQTPP